MLGCRDPTATTLTTEEQGKTLEFLSLTNSEELAGGPDAEEGSLLCWCWDLSGWGQSMCLPVP